MTWDLDQFHETFVRSKTGRYRVTDLFGHPSRYTTDRRPRYIRVTNTYNVCKCRLYMTKAHFRLPQQATMSEAYSWHVPALPGRPLSTLTSGCLCYYISCNICYLQHHSYLSTHRAGFWGCDRAPYDFGIVLYIGAFPAFGLLSVVRAVFG